MHPVEWNTGEAAGALAAHCLDHRLEPAQVREDPAALERFQAELVAGVSSWPGLR
ncbi:FAD-dependent oxidoreductase [Nonomuraea angiospora]|uniref:FAD-dependent oxidoreductase n=1 Tax=Nonomuraea angiospora TaxID=46172 RepID=UPI0029A8D7EA|nr:FAD-dependent oxidoreductase [Nonomuraea angiospora]MDX3100559.1 FAD-dependent oxidoreductase [Nonomuraea angiospora]